MPCFFFRVESQFCLISWSTFACSRIGLKLRFWNFQPIFLSMQFWHWLEGFYFFVICLTWNFHLKLSHGILIFISSGICRRKCQGSRFSHLEVDTWHFRNQLVFPNILKAVINLAIIWIILKFNYVVDLILDWVGIILVFYCQLCAFRIIGSQTVTGRFLSIKVCPSFGISVWTFIWYWVISFFLKLGMVLEAYVLLCMTDPDFYLKKFLSQKWLFRNYAKISSLILILILVCKEC